ncbi:hypothetical protein [Haloprofundus sp. MHR1]|uniref:hypothetical protein n=1 Tax=Haloprofundus sp. MHR1 TaxID=2572921 RepID=UPI0010BE9293|nr:hypothetical protein [Haloprofundus sp. MHR1]QCJ48379.1 hypothetical protein FCF25_15120 [Haloprofundus sp. MHR1]
MVSKRVLRVAGSATVALVALAGVVAAQQVPSPRSTPRFSPLVAVGGSFVFNLLVGGLLVVFVPDYLRRTTTRFRDDPVSTFLWGLLAFVVLVVGSILIITMIVTIPAMLVFGIVGNIIACVGIGMAIVGGGVDDSLLKPLAVGLLVVTLVSQIPILGLVVNFVIGMMGAGAMVNEFRDGR